MDNTTQKYTPKSARNLSARGYSDYKSRLKRAIEILGMTEDEFYKIRSLRSLKKYRDDLSAKLALQHFSKGVPSNIKSAFNIYLEVIERERNISKLAKTFYCQYDNSFLSGVKDIKTVRRLRNYIDRLNKVIDPKISANKIGREVLMYFSIEDENTLRKIRSVAKNLSKENDLEMFFTEPNTTARAIAIKAHLRKLSLLKFHSESDL